MLLFVSFVFILYVYDRYLLKLELFVCTYMHLLHLAIKLWFLLFIHEIVLNFMMTKVRQAEDNCHDNDIDDTRCLDKDARCSLGDLM